MSKIITDVEQYVTPFLKNRIPITLTFHNFSHTKDVVNAVRYMTQKSNLSIVELEMLTIAAWFHDTGHTIVYNGHEEESKKIATNYLSRVEYDKNKMQIVVDCINATKMPQKPNTNLEEILCDADLSHLSQQNYFVKNELLRREWELVLNQYYTNKEWYKLNLIFIKNHRYFSSYGTNTLEAGKIYNIRKLHDLFISRKKGKISEMRNSIGHC